jgi:hypothetical protein
MQLACSVYPRMVALCESSPRVCLSYRSACPLAQTPQTLRDRYGGPDIERFTAAHDIGLTVQYGSDGVACQIVIERKQNKQVLNYMEPEAVSEIIDELVPSASRGREKKNRSSLEIVPCARFAGHPTKHHS